MRNIAIVLLALIMCWGCNSGVKSGGQLSKSEIAYIQGLGILNEDETILLFSTQAGFKGTKQAANFFTDKRIAAYWVDEKRPENNYINSALFQEVEKMNMIYFSNDPTYCSEIEIMTKHGNYFSVYVDADSAATWKFFNAAVEVWQQHRK